MIIVAAYYSSDEINLVINTLGYELGTWEKTLILQLWKNNHEIEWLNKCRSKTFEFEVQYISIIIKSIIQQTWELDDGDEMTE